jgi:hypothetical protein
MVGVLYRIGMVVKIKKPPCSEWFLGCIPMGLAELVISLH